MEVAPGDVTLDVLQDLYAKTSGCPAVVHVHGTGRPEVSRGGVYSVKLSPVGIPCDGPPGTEAEAKAGIRAALEGLAELHKHGALGGPYCGYSTHNSIYYETSCKFFTIPFIIKHGDATRAWI